MKWAVGHLWTSGAPEPLAATFAARWVQAGQCLGQSQVDPAANQWFFGGFHGGFLSHEGTPK